MFSIELVSPFGSAWIYVVFVGLAVSGAYVLLARNLQKMSLAAKVIREIERDVLLAFFLTGHLLWILAHVSSLNSPLDALVVAGGRFSAWPAMGLAAWLGLALTRRHRISFSALADCVAPSLLWLWVCERLGASLAGQDVGYVAQSGLALAFPQNSGVFADHVQRLSLLPDSAVSFPTIAVGLYSAAIAGAGLAWMKFSSPTEKKAGAVALIAVALFACDSVVLDSFRVERDPAAIIGMTSRQFLGVCAGIAVAFLTWRRKHPVPMTAAIVDVQALGTDEKSEEEPVQPSNRKQRRVAAARCKK